MGLIVKIVIIETTVIMIMIIEINKHYSNHVVNQSINTCKVARILELTKPENSAMLAMSALEVQQPT